jgi:hypothetical protein
MKDAGQLNGNAGKSRKGGEGAFAFRPSAFMSMDKPAFYVSAFR